MKRLLRIFKNIRSPLSVRACTKAGYPKVYFIELTNHCNLRCSMCNFHSPEIDARRKKGFMDKGLALNIIDQIGSSPEEAWVSFHGAGESLLHKDMVEILRYASRFNNLKTGFLTNGMLLTTEVAEEIMNSGIYWIGFSIDGIDREKFERFRIGSDYERIIKNVLNFLDLKDARGSNIITRVNMTLQDEMKGDVDGFIDFWLHRVDEVMVSPCRPIGSRLNILAMDIKERVPCYMLYEMMVIYWDGKVGLCCEDWFNDGNMGDLNRQSITDVWEGKRFEKMRSLHERGDFGSTPLCRDCNSWYVSETSEYDEKRGCTVQKNAWQYVYRRA